MGIKTAFVYLPYLAFLVTMGSYVLACRYSVRSQAIWAMVLLAAFSMFFGYATFGGDAFNPLLPEKLIWFWNWAYTGAVLLMFLSLAWSIVRLVCRIAGASHVPGAGRIALPVIAWVLSAWGTYNGLAVPKPVEREFLSPVVPEELDGYRILQITDLHVSSASRRWRTEAVVERANAAGANLICLTGDLVDGVPRDRQRDIEPLRRLQAPDGVLAVAGNHEFYFDWVGWNALYTRWKIPFLQNDCVFPRPRLAVGGVNDWAAERVIGVPLPDVAQAFRTATNGEFRVLLQHRPLQAHANVNAHGVNLQLSGHTHGGVMPLMDLLVARFNDSMVRGWYDFGRGRAYVSTGSGQWAGFPIRFFNPVEMAVITLRRKR